MNCQMFPVFHKVDGTAELETLLQNGGFVLAWQVAWEGLRVARKIRVDAFGGILWELHRIEQIVHLRQERYVRKRKLPTGLRDHPVGGSVVLLDAWPSSPSMPVRGTGVRTRAGCLTSQVSKPPYSRACEREGLVTIVHTAH